MTEFAQLVRGALLRYRSWPDGTARLMYVSDGCEAIWGERPSRASRGG